MTWSSLFNNIRRSDKELKQLAALLWAQIHLKEVRALCDLATSLPEEHRTENVFFGLWTGVVVAYARSFTQNKGFPTINAKFGRFTSNRDQSLHDRLMEMRKHVHAHKDRSWEEEVAATSGVLNFVSTIFVTVTSDGETNWEVQRFAFPEQYFNDVRDLCEVQRTRLKQESDGMLKHFLEAHGVCPGRYDLGSLA